MVISNQRRCFITSPISQPVTDMGTNVMTKYPQLKTMSSVHVWQVTQTLVIHLVATLQANIMLCESVDTMDMLPEAKERTSPHPLTSALTRSCPWFSRTEMDRNPPFILHQQKGNRWRNATRCDLFVHCETSSTSSWRWEWDTVSHWCSQTLIRRWKNKQGGECWVGQFTPGLGRRSDDGGVHDLSRIKQPLCVGAEGECSWGG